MYFQVTMCNNGGCIHVSRSHRSTKDLPHGHNIVLHNLYHHLSSHEDVVYGCPQYGGRMKNICHMFILYHEVG